MYLRPIVKTFWFNFDAIKIVHSFAGGGTLEVIFKIKRKIWPRKNLKGLPKNFQKCFTAQKIKILPQVILPLYAGKFLMRNAILISLCKRSHLIDASLINGLFFASNYTDIRRRSNFLLSSLSTAHIGYRTREITTIGFVYSLKVEETKKIEKEEWRVEEWGIKWHEYYSLFSSPLSAQRRVSENVSDVVSREQWR